MHTFLNVDTILHVIDKCHIDDVIRLFFVDKLFQEIIFVHCWRRVVSCFVLSKDDRKPNFDEFLELMKDILTVIHQTYPQVLEIHHTKRCNCQNLIYVGSNRNTSWNDRYFKCFQHNKYTNVFFIQSFDNLRLITDDISVLCLVERETENEFRSRSSYQQNSWIPFEQKSVDYGLKRFETVWNEIMDLLLLNDDDLIYIMGWCDLVSLSSLFFTCKKLAYLIFEFHRSRFHVYVRSSNKKPLTKSDFVNMSFHSFTIIVDNILNLSQHSSNAFSYLDNMTRKSTFWKREHPETPVCTVIYICSEKHIDPFYIDRYFVCPQHKKVLNCLKNPQCRYPCNFWRGEFFGCSPLDFYIETEKQLQINTPTH